ncbi:unnamed protein product (macronuclear) [Paramecium tetraurelia]|uniref:Uncharacterized protein n=1 Tax=Paramecium tetraurelia TaxID=5888 RepID=A0BIQ9_PARTE|nr:uncharacterized protein GSPATT00004798001 [Paramecium tetraurelia]CAK58426.1 unnamed protein product [Paramecium tetraurelia]|eukprot:XP_001425824.1 hypothetical protein (macronuclear) [Paramecium tetraurelia strain d4-2]
MNDSDSQINNPLSNSHVSNFEQEQLIRLEESECDFECSQNPMLTEEENNEKSVVNSKLIQNSCKNNNISESSNQINKKSQFGSFLTSQQLESQQYKISIQQVDSRIGNHSGEEEIHENLRIVKEKLKELDLKVNCQEKEIQEIQNTYNQTKEELQQLKSDNENYKKDNMEIRQELQSYDSQIKKVQHLLSLLIQEKQLNGYDPPIQIQNKRSKTTIELGKEIMNNSHTQQKKKQTDSNGSPIKQCETPLSQQQAALLISSSKSYYHKPYIPQVQLFNANQLAALLKIPLNRRDEERKDIHQKSAGKDFNYLFHKPAKYNSINLNQVKGQGIQSSYSFTSTSMTK